MAEDIKEAKESEVVFEDELKEDLQEETNTPEETKKNIKKEIKNKLKQENLKLKEEIANLKNELLKDRAELENFKKRQKEEAIKDRIYANQTLITNLLTPLEYLGKACNFETESPELKNFLIGFQMIDKQIMDVLFQSGLKEIDAKVGEAFDPKLHHALETEKREDFEPNLILAVMSKGYIYKDRVIKPAMVKVSE